MGSLTKILFLHESKLKVSFLPVELSVSAQACRREIMSHFYGPSDKLPVKQCIDSWEMKQNLLGLSKYFVYMHVSDNNRMYIYLHTQISLKNI